MGKRNKQKTPKYLRKLIDAEFSESKPQLKESENKVNVVDALVSCEYKRSDLKPKVLSVESQLASAEEFVCKRYLANLNNADVVEFDKGNYPLLAGMTWFKITKMVYERGVFFPDQISTLYAAMHGKLDK